MSSAKSTKTLKSQKSTASMKSSTSTATPSQMVAFGDVVGEMVFEDIGILRSYTVLDYIRGGLEIKTMFAIDFTRSGGEAKVDESLHHAKPNNGDSLYAAALRGMT